MLPNFISHKHPQVGVDILFDSRYLNTDGIVTCCPGSVFEGSVKVKTSIPIPISHIKIVFKATERVNYDAMGWKKSKADDVRLFAIRNILWGLPATSTDGDSSPVYHILEAGDYAFPFTCQLPMINYPPTLQHHLIATAFNIVVSVVKANDSVSKTFPVYFQPIIETLLLRPKYTEEHKLSQRISAIVTVPKLAYNINERNKSIPVKVQLYTDNQENIHISHLCVYIKKCFKIKYKTCTKNEDTVVASYDHVKIPTTCPSNLSLKLDLPDSAELFPATLDYSPYLTIQYKLVVTVKIRHGPINFKKKIFDTPVIFGTLPVGMTAPRQLESYSDIKENTASIHCKPTFLKPQLKETLEEENLPAYDSIGKPPSYTIVSGRNSSYSMGSVTVA
ncbi:hypothetical protein HPULCUR_009660 [Helicostylum pulchrum]|uniref:Arrestin C-terminal-like domain-containing protein n=1 Tax=Helicostylum pulchrum TaxID=562976 RepID=A0ABP9YB30_9FUNG